MKSKSNSEEKKQTKDLIYKILNALEKEYKVNRGKTIPLENVFQIMEELCSLFNNYAEIELEKCTELIKARYIPLIKLLTKIDKDMNHKAIYLQQLENAYRLAARDDFCCFIIYYEWDWEYKNKLLEPRLSILSSSVYYLNEMAHNPNFYMIIMNLPSGWGKTRTVKYYEAWRLGRQPRETFMYLCSNDAVVKGGSRSIIDIIKNERYGKVFPNLSYQIYDKDLFLKETDGEWKIKDCRMLASYYALTVGANSIGQRASASIHIDDMYRNSEDAMNEKLNAGYMTDFLTVWRERFEKGHNPQVIVTGTLWAPNDFIARVIENTENVSKFLPHPKYKYTKISEDGRTVIIQVPALDPITDKSTCEDLETTQKLHEKRKEIIKNSGEYLWETNFQQNPTTPEGLEFDWKNIDTYEEKPNNQYNCAYAVIDGTRKSGKDFFSMPIGINYYEKHAIIDCIFTKTATSELIDDIVNKIIEHHIVKLVIESNVDGGLKRTLEEKLYKLDVYYCTIIEKYNTIPKKIRIEAEKGNIVNKLVFPSRNNIEKTEISRFMSNFTLYNSSGHNTNDDAPDSLAMYTSEIIGEKSKPSKAIPYKRFA